MKEFVGILVVMAIYSIAAVFLSSADGLSAVGITAPTGQNQMSLNAASDGVTTWSMVVVAACAAAVIAWWALGMFVFKAGRGEEGRWITYWWLLIILPVAASVCAILLQPKVEGNVIVLMLFDVLGGIFFYWLSAAMFSPPLTKHVPPGSRTLRFLP